MKKWFSAIGMIIIFIGVFVFYNKLYYPSLPIQSISKREVVQKLKDSDKKIVSLVNENGKYWYIIGVSNISIADEIIKEMISLQDWKFVQKEGSGLFFEKQGEKLIASTQMWTSNYVIVNIPVNFDE